MPVVCKRVRNETFSVCVKASSSFSKGRQILKKDATGEYECEYANNHCCTLYVEI